MYLYTMNDLVKRLKQERQAGVSGGIYHKTQVEMAYNSNRMEGSRLSHDQTLHIFDTRTIGFRDEDALPVDHIIETSNHFAAFNHLLDTLNEPLGNGLIKKLHHILKSGTKAASEEWFALGEWKRLPNEVGGTQTSLPADVETDMDELERWYGSCNITFEKIVEYHYRFERIHPFADGNGRVGRLVMFRECLRNDIVPFIIDERHKLYYYRGLREFSQMPGYLTDTCLSAQDTYRAWMASFDL